VQEAIAAQGLNLRIEIIEDGEEAMRLVDRLDLDPAAIGPALILLDINLPCASGLTVLEHIRLSERLSGVPVIVMTSSAAESDRTLAASLHADVYFQKPSDYDAFLELGVLIRKLLQAR
jgi:DNA-binding response OmpR family regulator